MNRKNSSTDKLDKEVVIEAGFDVLAGHLNVPNEPKGVVLFAHGSGSSRKSPRNLAVARALNQLGLTTLLFDLLTQNEESDRANVFDIELLAKRLTDATTWLGKQEAIATLSVGYFGASTGAVAALWAAADPASRVKAVVSRGGRADMAGPKLPAVRAATLLIVGGADDVVLDLNRQAQAQLRCQNQLEIIQGATHLFEEPGALEQVADLAGVWFLRYL